MATQDRATTDAPARRRPNWSIRTIVQNVSGHPIAHFQDPPPSLPASPTSVSAGSPSTLGTAATSDSAEGAAPDQIDAIYPPLVGALGREYHGTEHEHHVETMARHRSASEVPNGAPVAPGPLARPERIYLHYLLLHMDRLSDTALAYLGHAVEEERVHRAGAKRTVPRS